MQNYEKILHTLMNFFPAQSFILMRPFSGNNELFMTELSQTKYILSAV